MTGDLGNDAATASLNLGAKSMESLLRALEKLLAAIKDSWRNRAQRKMDKIMLEEAETRREKLEIIKKMQGVDGYINFKKLKKYCDAKQEKMLPRTMIFSDAEDIKLFKKISKDQHLLWSAIEDTDNKWNIMVSQSDMGLLEKCVQKCTDSKKIYMVQEKIASILDGRPYEECAEIDKKNIDLLKAEIESIREKWIDSYNFDAYEAELENAMFSHGEGAEEFKAKHMEFAYETFTGETYGKNDAFSAGLDANTGNEIDSGRISVLASLSNPDRYIVCNGEANPDKSSKQKIITSYEVHRQDGETKQFTDAGNWKETKEAMREYGGFGAAGSGEVLYRFKDTKEFEQWKELYKNQNENEKIRVRDDGEIHDAIKERIDELKAKGYEFKDGEVYSIKDKEKAKELGTKAKAQVEKFESDYKNNLISKQEFLTVKKNWSDIAEAVLIGHEINNYEELAVINTNLATAKTNLTIAKLNSDENEIKEAQAALDIISKTYSDKKEEQIRITEERSKVNGLQADIQKDEVNLNREHDRSDMPGLAAEESLQDNLEGYKANISARKENASINKPEKVDLEKVKMASSKDR